MRPDGTAEVEAYYIGKLYRGTVAQKEAKGIPEYVDKIPLNEFLNKPLTEAEQKAADKRQKELREQFPFLFKEQTPETPE